MARYFFFIWLSFVITTYGQEYHDQPMNPKGNSATQKEALPFYNEACELYAKGQVEAAKRSLYKAIRTDFALIEAHLFLGDLYQKEGKADSAMYFYNSGIDFATEQAPHYYFNLFKLGMELGEYELVKHNVNHFNKLYASKKHDTSRFETDFSYTKNDFEYYQACINFVYNADSWKPRGLFSKQLSASPKETFLILGGNLALHRGSYIQKIKLNGKKGRKIKGLPAEAKNISITGDVVVFEMEKNNSSDLYYATIKGHNIGKMFAFPTEINGLGWEGDGFLNAAKTMFYFSSDRFGSKDLFVAKLAPDDLSVLSVSPLSRINTINGDERSPFWDENTSRFYFSSDRGVGFGGFDLFWTAEYEVIDDVFYPFSYTNLKAPFNTNHNEIKLIVLPSKNFIIKSEVLGTIKWIQYSWDLMPSIDYNIRLNTTQFND